MYNRKTSGFTLMELMIVVAIVGILTAIAYPSYRSSVEKSRRAEGKGLLLDAANRQERRFADTNEYASDMTELGYADSPAISENGHYSVAAALTDGFTLTATPKGVQVADTKCATIMINARGQKTSTGGGLGCW